MSVVYLLSLNEYIGMCNISVHQNMAYITTCRERAEDQFIFLRIRIRFSSQKTDLILTLQ